MESRRFGSRGGCTRLTRRQFLAGLSAAAALGSCRQTPYQRSAFHLPRQSEVALLPAPGYDIDLEDVIFRGLQILRPEAQGRRVFLKPNMVEYHPTSIINTHPGIVAGAASAFLRYGAREVVIGEGPGHRRDVEYLLTATGLADYLKDLRVRFVDLNHSDVRRVVLRSNFTGLDALMLPTELLDSDFVVSLPKLKTHHWAGVTAGMKNLFGTVPGAVYGWPKNILHMHGIDQSILDITATLRPQFTIVDAVMAMEGDGPIKGRPRQTDFIAMGHDVVSVDATCARVMGLDPTKIPYLREASHYLGHLAEDVIVQRGEDPARYRTRFDLVDSISHLRLDI